MNLIKRTSKWKIAALVALLCVVGFYWRSRNQNFLSNEGFVGSDVTVMLNDNPLSLTSDPYYIVMRLTPMQAKALLQKFKVQKPCLDNSPPITPQQMPPAWTPNALWKPQAVKKYWSGSFETGDGDYPYHCVYVCDVTKPDSIILYFYAISIYN